MSYIIHYIYCSSISISLKTHTILLSLEIKIQKDLNVSIDAVRGENVSLSIINLCYYKETERRIVICSFER